MRHFKRFTLLAGLCASAALAFGSAPDSDPAEVGLSRSYLLLDGAALQSTILAARRLTPEFHSLYEHLVESEFVELAPHLFTYHSQSRAAQLWLAAGHGQGYGYRIISRASPTQLVAHLQQFLLADLADGTGTTQVYFRFYDPRVLHTVLRTLKPKQLRAFFGPIDAFVVESDDAPATDVVYVLDDTGALSSRLAPAPKSTRTADEAAAELEGLKQPGDEETVRKHLENFGQLQSFADAYASVTPFTSVCPCNAFKLTRASGSSLDVAQYKQFSAHALRWYMRRAEDSLAAGAGRGMTTEQLRARIEAGYQQARKYGLSSEGTVLHYLELCVRYGLTFHQKPWAQRVLADEKLDEDEKVAQLKATLEP
jgi:hypothetical protein